MKNGSSLLKRKKYCQEGRELLGLTAFKKEKKRRRSAHKSTKKKEQKAVPKSQKQLAYVKEEENYPFPLTA